MCCPPVRPWVRLSTVALQKIRHDRNDTFAPSLARSLARFRIVHLVRREKRKDSQNAMLPTFLSMQPKTKPSRSETPRAHAGASREQQTPNREAVRTKEVGIRKAAQRTRIKLASPAHACSRLFGRLTPPTEPREIAISRRYARRPSGLAGPIRPGRLADRPGWRGSPALLRWCFIFRNYQVVKVSWKLVRNKRRNPPSNAVASNRSDWGERLHRRQLGKLVAHAVVPRLRWRGIFVFVLARVD